MNIFQYASNGVGSRLRNSIQWRLSRARNYLSGSTKVVPQKWLPSQTYASRFSANWYQVYSRTSIQRNSPSGYGSIAVDLTSRLDQEFPDLGVLELKDGLLIGPDGWVVSKEGYLLPEHSWYGLNIRQMKIRRRLPESVRLKGVCLSLASDFALRNYGHFLLDCLSRFHLFTEAGFSLADVNYIYCPVPASSNAMRLLEKLGIPLKKCVWASGGTVIQADVVLATSFPGTRRNYPSWLANFLRRKFVTSATPPHRRIYISRGAGTRKIVNEQALLGILQKYGFELYDYSKHTDEPNYFAEAEIVVGAHGAGLANLAFCPPGAKVLELIPSDHVFPYFYTLSEAAGLKYKYLVGVSSEHREPSAWGPSPYDFRIEEEEFHNALAQIIEME